MKKFVFGAIIALSVASCGGEPETVETEAPVIDAAAVTELENATGDVEVGLINLEQNVNKLNSDVDSLLNGI